MPNPLELVWMKNKAGRTNGSIATSWEVEVPGRGGGKVLKHYQIIYTDVSQGIVGVPREAVNMILMIGPPSMAQKLRSVRTSGRAPDCGSEWMIAENQNPPAKVKAGSFIEIDGKRMN